MQTNETTTRASFYEDDYSSEEVIGFLEHGVEGVTPEELEMAGVKFIKWAQQLRAMAERVGDNFDQSGVKVSPRQVRVFANFGNAGRYLRAEVVGQLHTPAEVRHFETISEDDDDDAR